MGIPFIDRAPNEKEEGLLKLVLSTFCDGSGGLTTKSGENIPDWRDVERAVAAALGGIAPESKDVFDVLFIGESDSDPYVGMDVKTKAASSVNNRICLANGGLTPDCRAYLEVSNADGEFWDVLNSIDIKKSTILSGNNPNKAGRALIYTINGWHEEARNCHNCLPEDKEIDIDKSIYLALSYSTNKKTGEYWQFHSFPLKLKHAVKWEAKNSTSAKDPRSIVGYDSEKEDEVLYEYFFSSGSQFKYYPKISSALFSSKPFKLNKPKLMTLLMKAEGYWPEEYKKYL